MKLNEIKLLEATNLLEVKNFEDFYGGKTKFFVAVWHKRAPFSAPKGTYFGIGLVGENNTKVFDRVVDALYDEHQGMVTIRHVDDNDDVSSQLYLDIGKAKTDAYTSAEVFTDEKSAKAKVASWMKEAANRQVTDRAGTVLPIEIKPKAGTEWAEAHAALFKSRAKPSGVPKVKKQSDYKAGDVVYLTPMAGESKYEKVKVLTRSKKAGTYIVIDQDDERTEVPDGDIFGLAT